MNDCIFCKIAKGEFNTEFIYEDEFCVAFNDLNPQAPVHFLVVPKVHIETLKKLDDEKFMGKMLNGVIQASKKLNLNDYRTVINCGKEAGQEVFHLHFHVLSGRPFNWPPG